MKYILKEKIPFTDYEVGHVFETKFTGDIKYRIKGSDTITNNIMMPHEILVMVKAGILEEYDDTFPKVGDRYWYIDSFTDIQTTKHLNCKDDKYRIKTNNYFRTKEAAEARLKEIMGE